MLSVAWAALSVNRKQVLIPAACASCIGST